PGLRLRHGVATVVNPHSVIGAGVMLRHGATIGNRRSDTDCPTIEDDVEFGAGATVIGSVRIGRGARLGANVVVIEDVPAGATVYSPSTVIR
ncbi:MAG: serine acetyltransferase, partial [Actinomycetia bacterium]|nr:serine acetyltransferase [Actinomycetes bacterium]